MSKTDMSKAMSYLLSYDAQNRAFFIVFMEQHRCSEFIYFK